MTDHQVKKSRSKSPSMLGKAVEKRREQLAQMKEEDKRRRQAEQDKRSELERLLTQLETQHRSARRQTEASERKRACYLLGAIVLEELVQENWQNTDSSNAILKRLKPAQSALIYNVLRVIERDKKHAEESTAQDAVNSSIAIDIPL